jgi:hypothetical protein
VADPQGGGYWLVTKDAKIYALGTAHLYGEANGEPPVAGSVAAMSALPDANGYWLLSSAGTVYAFGAAKNFTFTGGNKPPSGSSFVGIAAFPDGDGYWLVTSTGYVEGFGETNLRDIRIPVGSGRIGLLTPRATSMREEMPTSEHPRCDGNGSPGGWTG